MEGGRGVKYALNIGNDYTSQVYLINHIVLSPNQLSRHRRHGVLIRMIGYIITMHAVLMPAVGYFRGVIFYTSMDGFLWHFSLKVRHPSSLRKNLYTDPGVF